MMLYVFQLCIFAIWSFLIFTERMVYQIACPQTFTAGGGYRCCEKSFQHKTVPVLRAQ